MRVRLTEGILTERLGRDERRSPVRLELNGNGSRVLLSVVVIIAVRCLLVALFLPFSALDKLLNFSQAVDQAAAAVPARWGATLLIWIGLGIEVVMSLAILTGVADRLAAFILAGYCLITAVLWKRFWKAPDFRLKGPSGGREIFWDFLKNLALAAGFLLLTFGTDAAGAHRFWSHPLASTHPYAALEQPDGSR